MKKFLSIVLSFIVLVCSVEVFSFCTSVSGVVVVTAEQQRLTENFARVSVAMDELYKSMSILVASVKAAIPLVRVIDVAAGNKNGEHNLCRLLIETNFYISNEIDNAVENHDISEYVLETASAKAYNNRRQAIQAGFRGDELAYISFCSNFQVFAEAWKPDGIIYEAMFSNPGYFPTDRLDHIAQTASRLTRETKETISEIKVMYGSGLTWISYEI